jgi:hypothetical protein
MNLVLQSESYNTEHLGLENSFYFWGIIIDPAAAGDACFPSHGAKLLWLVNLG